MALQGMWLTERDREMLYKLYIYICLLYLKTEMINSTTHMQIQELNVT